jgi:uncharacterized protein
VAGEVLYLDASALVKLVVLEPQSAALADEVGRWQGHLTSVVGAVEVRRAALRAGASAPRVDDVLTRVAQLDVDAGVLELASKLDPPELRTLDALHLASAISLEDDLGAFACYDERLANAAAREGLRVLAPA